jgi:hypothetical protein
LIEKIPVVLMDPGGSNEEDNIPAEAEKAQHKK